MKIQELLLRHSRAGATERFLQQLALCFVQSDSDSVIILTTQDPNVDELWMAHNTGALLGKNAICRGPSSKGIHREARHEHGLLHKCKLQNVSP